MESSDLEIISGTGRTVLRPDESVLVGRDPTCQLIIDDKLVSRHHARVEFGDGGWVLRDLDSTNGTYLGGERRATIAVADGVEVRLGSPERGPVMRFAVAAAVTGKQGADATGALDDLPVTQVARAGAVPVPVPAVATATMAMPVVAPRVPAPQAPVSQPSAPLAPAPPVLGGRAQTAEYDAGERIRIGRGPDNDIVLDDLLISRKHAEVRRVDGAYQVIDLGSRNGTFHNGQQVPRATLNPGDLISIGRHEFVFDGRRLHEYVDTGPISLAAEDLTVQIGKKVLLDDVSFALSTGSLLALIGPSGCGKSTLLRALTGIRPASMGKVRYDGRDLYADYAELRYRIGMVPQDDVLHRQLTVRKALRFAASLRFAQDVPRRERKARVDEVIETLGLTERAKARIDTLSGGQRKRASVAMELLTEPSLLCLDEPTSGLDPALDKEVMEELRELSDRGRTVVVVTHNVLHLDMCDRVMVLCQGGTLGYFGPPSRVLEFFQAKDYAEVFAKVTDEAAVWSQRFRVSDIFREYVVEPMITMPARKAAAVPAQAPAPGQLAPAPMQPAPVPTQSPQAPAPGTKPDAGTQPAPGAKPAPGTGSAAGTARRGPVASLRGLSLGQRALHPTAPLRQFVTLCARMMSVIAADRGYALFLLGLPLALALLTHSVPGDNGLAPPPLGVRFSLEAQRLLVVLVVGAAFMGIAPAIREIVAESGIYRRERAVGLSAGAYLASKLTVFSLIYVVQVVIFVYLSLLGRQGPAQALVLGAPLTEVMVPVAMVAVTCGAFGLVVSALVRTTEQTTPVLVIVVMTQLVLSGGLFELAGENGLEQISWLAQTRWGFAAGASTVDLLNMIPFEDPLWEHTASAWWRSILLLVVHLAVLAAAARLALRRNEPGR